MLITEAEIIQRVMFQKRTGLYHPNYLIGKQIKNVFYIKILSEQGKLIAMVENNKVKRIVPASFVYNMKFKAVIEGVLSGRFRYAKKTLKF